MVSKTFQAFQALYKLTAAHLGVFMIGTYVVEQVIGMYALNPTI